MRLHGALLCDHPGLLQLCDLLQGDVGAVFPGRGDHRGEELLHLREGLGVEELQRLAPVRGHGLHHVHQPDLARRASQNVDVLVLVFGLDRQVRQFQNEQHPGQQSGRDPRAGGDLVHRGRPQSLLEAPGQVDQEHHGHLLPLQAAGVGARALLEVGLEMLQGVGELRPKQHDDPAQVHPDQKQRQLREAAVDGVVLVHAHLVVDVSPLGRLPDRARQHAPHQGRKEPHPGVGKEHVGEGEHHADDGQRRQLEGRDHHEVHAQALQRLVDCAALVGAQSHGRRDGHDHRRHQGHGEKVRELAPQRTPLHSPNGVEGLLHVAHHQKDRQEQRDQPHRAQGLDVGLLDVEQDLLHHLAPARGHLLQDRADELGVLQAQPLGDGESHGEERHDGQDGGVGQSRGPDQALVPDEAVDHQVGPAGDVVQPPGQAPRLPAVGPDVLGEVSPDVLDSAIDGHVGFRGLCVELRFQPYLLNRRRANP